MSTQTNLSKLLKDLTHSQVFLLLPRSVKSSDHLANRFEMYILKAKSFIRDLVFDAFSILFKKLYYEF